MYVDVNARGDGNKGYSTTTKAADDLSCYLLDKEIDYLVKGAPLVVLTASLVSTNIQVTPRLEDIQDAIMKASKIILSTSKGVSQWLRGRKQEVSAYVYETKKF